MKLFLIILLVWVMAVPVSGQEKLPPFRIGLVNGTYFSSQQFHPGKPVLLVYFDPDCEACSTFTKLLKGCRPVFQKYHVLMVTNTDLDKLRHFADAFGLGDQKGLIIGTEGWTRSLQRALGISRFPYIALYNKNGQLVQHIMAPTPEAEFQILKASTKL